METGVEEIRQEVMTIPDQAKIILVRNAESMTKGTEFFLVIKGLRKKIDDTFNPIIKKAHEAHAEAIAQKKKVEEPLIVAERWLNGQMTAYKLEQDRIREAEEQRLRQIAFEEEMHRRRLDEEQRLAEAATLEALGAKDEAEQVMAEILQENEAPVIISTPKSSIPKIELKGITSQTNWTYEITNEKLIPKEYWIIDEKTIGAIVRKQKERTNIPGIRPIPDNKMRATGR